ncbi:MAG: universal stress protein, UspA [Methylophaga sp.]|nr:MAG: universal stress protein, UspA [Methylophaga sp.]
MQKFNNILVVLDPETEGMAALDRAVSLAKSNGGRLTLLSVLKEPSYSQIHGVFAVQQQLKSAASERREWLQDLMIPRQDSSIDLAINIIQGTAFLEIIRQVLREQHDLVITTAEDKKELRARLFGTTSMHLMRKCPCPVWVVKREQLQPHTRILAAVDPSHDPSQDSLNQLILQLASNIALKEEAELHIVHVWHLFGERYVRDSGMTKQDFEETKALEEKLNTERLDSLLNRDEITSLQPHLHLIEGDPDECIPEVVREQDIDLLVMGTVCRTGIAGFLIGNTAEEVLNQVDCSVLTLKPEGFVTPVVLE